MTTILNPARPEVQAAFLKAHLRLMAVGMTNSQFSMKQMLAKATAITGTRYTKGTIDVAINDLQSVIDEATK